MPGVVVTTATRTGGTGNAVAPSGQAFLVGLLERGSTTEPILVNSLADVEQQCGTRPTFGTLWDQLKVFFDEGGRQAYIARVVGSGADVGTLTLEDRAGTPVDTLRIDAANPGAWSSDLTVQVRDGAVADTFRITVYLDGEVVEDVNNIDSPTTAVTKFASSKYIRATNLASGTVAPGNNPAVLAATALSAGDDDRAALVDADYVDGLDLFNIDLGDGAVAIPGKNSGTIVEGVIDHCEANRRIGIIGHDFTNLDYSDVVTLTGTLSSEYVGVFGPYVVISDGAGGTRTVSPEGFVMACRARAHLTGPWRVPGGQAGEASTLLDVASSISTATLELLDEEKVSVIRKFPNSIRLYGWRSMSTDTDNYAYLKDRDLLNRLVNEAEARLEDYVFDPIDGRGQLLSAIDAELVGMVAPYAAKGGLFARVNNVGDEIDPGYRVETGTHLNPPASLAQNKITARLSVRVSPTGDLIQLTITKVGLLSGL